MVLLWKRTADRAATATNAETIELHTAPPDMRPELQLSMPIVIHYDRGVTVGEAWEAAKAMVAAAALANDGMHGDTIQAVPNGLSEDGHLVVHVTSIGKEGNAA